MTAGEPPVGSEAAEPEATLSEDVALLVAQASAVAFAYDVDAGLIPPDAARALFPHELAAHTNFAAVDAQIDATGEQVRQVMADLRDAYAAALIAELEAADDPLAVVDAIASPETTTRVSGLTELLAIATGDAVDVLLIAYDAGVRQVRDEARAQGVTVGELSAFAHDDAPDVPDGVFAERASRVAGETVDAVDASVIRRAAALDPYTPMALELLTDAARETSAGAALADAAGLAGGAVNAGRLAGMRTVDAARQIYASEVLDRRTCGPCQAVDGTTYDSEAEAADDYPSGYKSCEGGVRCRGTLVAVWGDEETPTVDDPGGRPEPPPLPPNAEALGDKLRVSPGSESHPHVAAILSDLEEIPAGAVAPVRDTVEGVYVGEGGVPDLDDMGHLAGVAPRGHPPGSTWDTVPGCYSPGRGDKGGKLILGGGKGTGHGSTSLCQHEFGHAYDDALGYASRSDEFAALADEIGERMGNRINPYYRKATNPSGYTSEMFAEGFAAWVKDGQYPGALLRGLFGATGATDLALYYQRLLG